MSSVTFIASSEREFLREIASILGQELCYVSRNILRSCEAGLEAGSWHCSTLLEIKVHWKAREISWQMQVDV